MVEKVKNNADARSTKESNKINDETLELDFIRHKLEKFQDTIINDVKQRIAIVVDEVMQELQQHELQIQEFKNFANNNSNSKRNKNKESSTWSNRILKATNSQQKLQNNDESGTDEAVGDDDDVDVDIVGDENSDSAVPKKSQAKSKANRQQKSNSSKVLQTLPDKIFIARESYLTALLKVDHMRSIYHIFQIIFLVLCSHTIAHDYFVEGKVNFGLQTFKSGFRGIHHVLVIWLLEHVFVFSLYYAFRLWSFVREKLQKQVALQRFWSHSCLILYIASQLVFGYIGTVMCLKLNLPYVTSCVLLLESTRLLMKMHAFVRTNAARVIAGKLKCDDDLPATTTTTKSTRPQLAPFSWYLYFIFAPTLLCRDSYPRTTSIRWKFALCRFAEGLAVAFLFAYLHERHMAVHFGNYGLEPVTDASLIVKIFGMCMPSIIIFLGGFYLILHAWLNFTAELLRFGDRMFYKDWWTAHNYDAYYRKWNVVVHDWLYEYIYKDMYNHVCRGSKTAASLMVFTVSALVHEHILGFALKFFFPVMFVFFGLIGVFCVFVTRHAPKSIGNLFLWFSLIAGNCLMVSLYYMEYYARKNCEFSVENESWRDVLTPMLWKCSSTRQ